MPEPLLEHPPWVTAMVDQRLAQMREAVGGSLAVFALTGASVVMTMLTEPPEDATRKQINRWERACDRCGVYCPGSFYTGAIQREVEGIQFAIAYGACPLCAGSKEV